MTPSDLPTVYARLKEQFAQSTAPIVAFQKAKNKTPFTCLIGTILSARTKDSVTLELLPALFDAAGTPQKMAALSVEEIEKLIIRVNFYKAKAVSLKKTAQKLIDDFGGEVPQDIDSLLTLSGVGRKTANIVLVEMFGASAISVDIHVHRITNRWGLVHTKTPEETEQALMKVVPKEYWSATNSTLVAHGQTICEPIIPKCSECVVSEFCARVGVTRSK